MTPRGALVVVPSGVVHTNRKFACTFRCVFMEFKALQNTAERFLEQAIGGLNFRAVVLEDSEFMKDFLQLHRAMKKGGPVLGRESALLSFLHTLAARHSTATVRVPRDGNEGFAVKRSKQYLEEHYAERVLLQDLARLTGLSPYHLNRSFCRIIGMPPHAYQLQVRLARARWLLRRGQSIIETALLAGFADQSHFTRHFKRAVGVTPGEYLR